MLRFIEGREYAILIDYDRALAVAYARQWALSRNPAYLDFHTLGGDCTNFVSQCLFAGSGVMNFTPVFGWYYLSGNNRTASWTSVEYLYRFLTENDGNGPFGNETPIHEIMIGDIVQLANRGERFSHAGIVTAVESGELLIAAHTTDAWMKPLSSYQQPVRRFIHIQGVRVL